MARKKKIILPTSRTRPVELNGEPYIIEFNFRAYAAMKELTGISLLMGWDEDKLDAKEYACLLFSALITHHPDIEFDFCLNTLNGENFVGVVKALWDAYRASLPKPTETSEANPQKPIAKNN
jgi:hypothetical protein